MSNAKIGFRVLSSPKILVNYDLRREKLTLKYLLNKLTKTRVLSPLATLNGL